MNTAGLKCKALQKSLIVEPVRSDRFPLAISGTSYFKDQHAAQHSSFSPVHMFEALAVNYSIHPSALPSLHSSIILCSLPSRLLPLLGNRLTIPPFPTLCHLSCFFFSHSIFKGTVLIYKVPDTLSLLLLCVN